jgi:hypothetical protein
MGWASFGSVQLTFAGSLLAASMHAPILALMALGLATQWVTLEGWHAALFGVGYGGVVAAAIAARSSMLGAVTLVTLPLYWPLLSLAMLRALWELRSRPHFWAKTPHGAGARKAR